MANTEAVTDRRLVHRLVRTEGKPHFLFIPGSFADMGSYNAGTMVEVTDIAAMMDTRIRDSMYSSFLLPSVRCDDGYSTVGIPRLQALLLRIMTRIPAAVAAVRISNPSIFSI